uniref:Uncharacterized protein n=1 Tax=Cajanus cajan TaxID=3821 RepID=A0A151STU7_CAJCA|nr:hypothetical protein KK1_004484 [Cajanus cajan]
MSEERILNPQLEIHGSVPSSVQCNKQCSEPEFQVPMSEERVLPTERVQCNKQSTSTLIPISSGGIPQAISEPEHVSQSASIVSELDHDKTLKPGETLHELDAFTQVKESCADEETKDSGAALKLINLLPSLENTNKELRTGQQALPRVHQLNEMAHDEPNIELNLIPLSAEPESPSEQSSKTVEDFVEKQLPKTDVVEDTKTKLAIATLSNVDTSTSNVRPSTDVNIPVVGSSHALEISQPESMPSEQDLCAKRDP